MGILQAGKVLAAPAVCALLKRALVVAAKTKLEEQLSGEAYVPDPTGSDAAMFAFIEIHSSVGVA